VLDVPLSAWLVLVAVVAVGLAVDLIAHRGDRGQGRRRAIYWSIGWISTALLFGVWVMARFGRAAGEDFFTAFLVEKSLSVDNLFVFIIVFGRLRIPEPEQHRVLQYGIIGAFLTRGVFIAAGSALLSSWHGVVYVLGAFLIYTGIKTAREQGHDPKEAKGEGKLLPFLRRHLPVTDRLHGHHFITVEAGRRVATPLLLALIVIEATDVVFAVDSIPAVFAITEDPFIVYSSNIFALLGLRALYSVLADLLADLKYLRYGLGAILAFAGLKMLGSRFVHVPHIVSLLAIAGVLLAAVIPSVIARRRRKARAIDAEAQ
jgi:tellurite resistance protein TerC